MVYFLLDQFSVVFVMAVVAVNTILDGSFTKIDPAWCEHSHLWCIKGYKVISQGLMLVFLHPFNCFIIFSMCQLLIFADVMHPSTLIWWGVGGRGRGVYKGWGFDKGRSHPSWGLVIIAKSWGWGLLKFLLLRMTSWIGSCERPVHQSVISCIRTGIGNWRWQPLFPQGFVGIFYTHVQDGGWKRAWRGICFYPLYSYSNKYISSFMLLF